MSGICLLQARILISEISLGQDVGEVGEAEAQGMGGVLHLSYLVLSLRRVRGSFGNRVGD